MSETKKERSSTTEKKKPIMTEKEREEYHKMDPEAFICRLDIWG